MVTTFKPWFWESDRRRGDAATRRVILCSKALTTNACESVWLACQEGKNKAAPERKLQGSNVRHSYEIRWYRFLGTSSFGSDSYILHKELNMSFITTGGPMVDFDAELQPMHRTSHLCRRFQSCIGYYFLALVALYLQPIVSTEKCSAEKHERMTYGFQLFGHKLHLPCQQDEDSMGVSAWFFGSAHTNIRTHANTQTQTRYKDRNMERERERERERETHTHKHVKNGMSRKDNHIFELSCAT